MFWYKSWLETRWRFLIGLALLMLSACSVVFAYPRVMRLMPLVSRLPEANAAGEIGRRIREAAALAGSYSGYIWSQWYRQNLVQVWTVFAALLGTGGLLSKASSGGALFTLSMPISRRRVLAIRAATGLAEVAMLAFVPSLLVPLLSPAVGESYGVATALGFSVGLFLAGAVFYCLAFFLSTIFSDIWRPALIALSIAAVIALYEQFWRESLPYGPFHLMSGDAFFRTGHLPWLGLASTSALSAVMFYAASVTVANRDF